MTRSTPRQRMRSGLLVALFALLSAVGTAHAEIVLRFSWWGGNEVHRALLDSVRSFERRHPGIRVKTEYTGWAGHLERLTTQIAGGTAPDLMQINWNWLPLFSSHGDGFRDLRTHADVIDLDAFDAEAVAMGEVHGRLNALPTSMAARLLYFNVTTFEKAGLTIPDSWDSLLAAGPVFRDRLGPDYYPLDLHLQDAVALTRSWMVQQTGRPMIDEAARRLTVSPEQLAAMLRFYQSLVDAHVVPAARVRASYGHVAPHELRTWIDGRWAGSYQWISAIGKFIETLAPGQTVALAPYPMLPDARDAGLLYRPAMMLAVNAHSPHAREAAQLLDFLLNDPEAVRLMGLRRGDPVSARARAVLHAHGDTQDLTLEAAASISAIPHAVKESAWFEHARVRDAFIDVFESFAYGRMDADAGGQRLHADINRILARIIR